MLPNFSHKFLIIKIQIIIGCRDTKKGENAVNDIKLKNPKADISILKLDLSSLKSIRQFVKSVESMVSTVDILINNAGVMMCPEWQTEDGFEMQFGTNHLGINKCVIQLLYFYLTFRPLFINSIAITVNQEFIESQNNKRVLKGTLIGKNSFREYKPPKWGVLSN